MNYLTAILGVLFALSTSFGAYEYVENGKLKADVIVAKDNEKSILESNKLKDDAVIVLGQKLGEAAGKAQEIEAAKKIAIDQLADKSAALAKTQAETKRLRSQIYARDKASRTWAYSPVPASLTRELQARWCEAGGDDGSGCGRSTGAVRGDSGHAPGVAAPWRATDAVVLGCGEDGCFSGDQMLGALDSALTWGSACVAKLEAIAVLQDAAIRSVK